MERHIRTFNFKKFAVCCLVFCVCFSLFTDMEIQSVRAEKAEPQYKIMVNRAANCVTVYEKDADGEFSVPVKAFVCSCGRKGHSTPLGTFRTSDYYLWRNMVDGSYGQYAVRFNKGIMFHSIPYYTMNAGNMEWEQFNLLGEPASLGCVRLACADAKWIYENCAAGTEVVVYDDAENPGPLGKPEALKLTAGDPNRKWDPTDTNSLNPWNAVRPSLYLTHDSGDKVLYLPVGASQDDIYSLIGMKDAEGTAYDEGEYSITVRGSYDLNTAGVYKVSVRGIGALELWAEEDIILCVV